MRTSSIVTVLATMLWIGSTAFGDAKTDAQGKVDASKTETCEKGKKFLAEQEAKGKCKTESAEAKKITCSASTFAAMNDLLNKCTTGKSADAKPADPAAPTSTTKCRALDVKDDKVVFEEAEDPSNTKCLRALLDKLQKKWCSAENKGKKFEYMTNYDHVVGKGKFAKQIKGRKETYTCRVVNK